MIKPRHTVLETATTLAVTILVLGVRSRDNTYREHQSDC
jgi:hypothetical protein